MRELVLPDTSVWIDFFRNRDSTAVARLSRELKSAEHLVVASIVMGEVFCGAEGAQAMGIRAQMAELRPAPELDRWDFVAAAELFVQARHSGRSVRGYVDCLIAQTCIRWGYALLTSDRDFTSIAAVAPLRLLT
ncbi:MAG: PIN domain nuclease [Acidobacteria bacterium]|nr:MAG: PIN domain nuclease [Acidobacteriota bacterium]